MGVLNKPLVLHLVCYAKIALFWTETYQWQVNILHIFAEEHT